jgi:hypothetical protein
MVSGMAQRKALNDTALGTATWIVTAANRIKAEMEKQNIDRHPKLTPVEVNKMNRFLKASRYTTDDKEPITFERGQIRQLLDEMAERVEALRRFENPKANADD